VAQVGLTCRRVFRLRLLVDRQPHKLRRLAQKDRPIESRSIGQTHFLHAGHLKLRRDRFQIGRDGQGRTKQMQLVHDQPNQSLLIAPIHLDYLLDTLFNRYHFSSRPSVTQQRADAAHFLQAFGGCAAEIIASLIFPAPLAE
jgi:hypothetical protein